MTVEGIVEIAEIFLGVNTRFAFAKLLTLLLFKNAVRILSVYFCSTQIVTSGTHYGPPAQLQAVFQEIAVSLVESNVVHWDPDVAALIPQRLLYRM